MNSGKFAAFLVAILLGSPAVDAQAITVRCEFEFTQSTFYTCSLPDVTIPDDPYQEIVFDTSGHVEGLTNDDVVRATVYGGSVPFIITQFFTTFPNIRMMAISPSGLLRIQSKAFVGAYNLEQFASYRNPLTTVESYGFAYAQNLTEIDLYNNAITTIDNNAFEGLESLIYLNIGGNNISTLSPELFSSLSSLTHFSGALNQIASLPGNTFANNRRLRNVDFFNNRIDAIGRSFLDSLDDVITIDLRGNVCSTSFWTLSNDTTIDVVRKELEPCFANFVEPPNGDVKTFVMELRGTLIIRDQNGNEVGRL